MFLFQNTHSCKNITDLLCEVLVIIIKIRKQCLLSTNRSVCPATLVNPYKTRPTTRKHQTARRGTHRTAPSVSNMYNDEMETEVDITAAARPSVSETEKWRKPSTSETEKWQLYCLSCPPVACKLSLLVSISMTRRNVKRALGL